MRALAAIRAAFALFSRLPVRAGEWDEDTRGRILAWFPLVGVVLGLIQFGALYGLNALGVSPALWAAAAVVLPIAYTGGIHMDGFMDVIDAVSARAPREKMLEILHDPRCGAFAVIAAGCWLLLAFGLWQELAGNVLAMACLCAGYGLSRAMSAWCALTFPSARPNGLLRDLTQPAVTGARRGILIWAQCSALAMVVLGGIPAGAALAGALIAALLYGRLVRRFGGTTGDLAGWFLMVCELVMLAAVVLIVRLMEVL